MNKYLLSSLLSIACLSAFGQEFKVEGKIVNTDNQPLAGVSVRLYNDTTLILRAMSNNKGDFTTHITEQTHTNLDNLTIAISCLGYESQVIPLSTGQCTRVRWAPYARPLPSGHVYTGQWTTKIVRKDIENTLIYNQKVQKSKRVARCKAIIPILT